MNNIDFSTLTNQYKSVVEQNKNLQTQLNIYKLTLTAIKEVADQIYDESEYEDFINQNIYEIKKLTDEALSCDLKHYENLLNLIEKPQKALDKIKKIAQENLKYRISGYGSFEPTKSTKILEQIINECEAIF